MNCEKKTFPWGYQKFEAPNTYAPKFHQPARLMHVDRNSQIELKWNDVKRPVKPKTVVEEMQQTLDKINVLLTNLSSRSTSKTSPQQEAEPVSVNVPAPGKQSATPPRDSTLNSSLESLSRDITAMTAVLQERSKASLSAQIVNQDNSDKAESSIKSTETDSGICLTESLGRSRTCSSNTINSSVTSLKSSQNANPIIPSPSPGCSVDGSECSGVSSTRKRSISEATSCIYRGSEAAQIVSLHRSSFASIAALSGFEEVENRFQRRSREISTSSKQDRIILATPEAEMKLPRSQHQTGYYTEYPPQKGGSTFKGIFEHDISALHDDSARGLLSF